MQLQPYNFAIMNFVTKRKKCIPKALCDSLHPSSSVIKIKMRENNLNALLITISQF